MYVKRNVLGRLAANHWSVDHVLVTLFLFIPSDKMTTAGSGPLHIKYTAYYMQIIHLERVLPWKIPIP